MFHLEVTAHQCNRIATRRGHRVQMKPATGFPGKHDAIPVAPDQLPICGHASERAARALGRTPNLVRRAGRHIDDPNRPGQAPTGVLVRQSLPFMREAEKRQGTAVQRPDRLPITVDIGFGDAIADPGYTIEYPSLLDMPTANIRAYPPAAVIAEKFQAIVDLGLANGRMKDYYDLWAIPNAQAIEPADLDAAIRATFERRGTDIPSEPPVGLSPEFINDALKTTQWAAYAASIDLDDLSLESVVEKIWSYIGPACERLTAA